MKVVEGLALRADLVHKIKETRYRAQNAARFQEGEEPSEDSMELHKTSLKLIDELEELTARINHRNADTEIMSDQLGRLSVTQALAKRDALAARREAMNGLADSAGNDGGIYGRCSWASELREVTNVPVGKLRASADKASKAHRELDVLIQQSNWATDL